MKPLIFQRSKAPVNLGNLATEYKKGHVILELTLGNNGFYFTNLENFQYLIFFFIILLFFFRNQCITIDMLLFQSEN